MESSTFERKSVEAVSSKLDVICSLKKTYTLNFCSFFKLIWDKKRIVFNKFHKGDPLQGKYPKASSKLSLILTLLSKQLITKGNRLTSVLFIN